MVHSHFRTKVIPFGKSEILLGWNDEHMLERPSFESLEKPFLALRGTSIINNYYGVRGRDLRQFVLNESDRLLLASVINDNNPDHDPRL